MEIPIENVLAFFPPEVKAGNITLGPLTLSGVVRLGERGIDLAQRIPTDRLFEVAYVLSEKCSSVRMFECSNELSCYRAGREARPVRTRGALAAWLGNQKPGDYKRFLRHVHVGLNELANAVNKVLNDAFATYVKPAKGEGGTIHLTPHGLGMPLEYAEFLCAEYGWSFETAINTPLATVFALVAAHRQRNGNRHGGFDYIEKHYAESLKKKRDTVDRRKE